MSENAVAIRNEITEQKIIEYLDAQGMTKKLSKEEKTMFIRVAQEFGLSPFKREIHITAYGEGEYRSVSIITGYEVYIKRAERTGKLDGWKCWTEGSGKTLKAIIEIYRKDQAHPFTHEVYYEESVQTKKDGYPNRTWAKMPRFMLRKVAIGQGFRLCFPDEMGGMPYEESEVPQAEEYRVVTPVQETEEFQQEPNPPYMQEPNQPADANEDKKHTEVRKQILQLIGGMLSTETPDKLLYFSQEEVDQERDVARGAANNKALQRQLDRLQKTLEKRKAEYKEVPFDDPPPADDSEESDSRVETLSTAKAAMPAKYDEPDDEEALARSKPDKPVLGQIPGVYKWHQSAPESTVKDGEDKEKDMKNESGMEEAK